MSYGRLTEADLARMSEEDREKLTSGRAAQHAKLKDYKSPDYGRINGPYLNGERGSEKR